MRMSHVLGLVAALAAAAPIAGCREPKTPAQSIAELRSPDAEQRRRAADDLRTDAGVAPEAIQPLLQAAAAEQTPNVLGAMLITLGRSGVPEAKPLIDKQIPSTDKDMRRWAGRALKYWMIKTGQLDKDYKFPDGWPYGTPGFPAKLPD
jgi:hypothetical protein